jgi:hypothetical protein
VIVYDVPKELEFDDLRDSIWTQNLEELGVTKEAFSKGFKEAFRTGRRDRETRNWVCEVPPECRNRLRELGRLYIGWHSCRVADFVGVTRCFNCQGYGHPQKYCPAKDKPTCGHCGRDGHGQSACPSKEQPPVCPNCTRAKKPAAHGVADPECPALKYALEKELRRTNYL